MARKTLQTRFAARTGYPMLGLPMFDTIDQVKAYYPTSTKIAEYENGWYVFFNNLDYYRFMNLP